MSFYDTRVCVCIFQPNKQEVLYININRYFYFAGVFCCHSYTKHIIIKCIRFFGHRFSIAFSLINVERNV